MRLLDTVTIFNRVVQIGDVIKGKGRGDCPLTTYLVSYISEDAGRLVLVQLDSPDEYGSRVYNVSTNEHDGLLLYEFEILGNIAAFNCNK